MAPPVRSGLTRLIDQELSLVRGARVALLVNHTSVDAELCPSAVVLARRGDVDLRFLLAPEHGPWGTHQDMEPVAGSHDPILDRPVVSLYGEDEYSLRPAEAALADVDVMIFDIQDVGARYYTFVYTLLHAMQVAARTGTRVIVCDRPNPLDGLAIEGNLVGQAWRSFVGRWPLPNRHGLTVGELARLFNEACGAELHVVPMDGWRRHMRYEDTGLPWVAPSPNMPRLETATLYPGQCLLEGTNLSEGRGSTLPFELFGAPWLDALGLARDLTEARLPGLRFRPTRFRPMFQKHAGCVCSGVQIHITEPRAVAPVLVGLTVVERVRRRHPEHFAWRTEPYEFVSDRLAFDLLAGTDAWRLALEAGETAGDILARHEDERADFAARRREVLLYD